MPDQKFSIEDPVLAFDFLTGVFKKADTLGMDEGKLIVCLPHVLNKNAAQHSPSPSSHSRSGVLVCWPYAIQYMIHTYTTTKFIRCGNFEDGSKKDRDLC